MKVGSPTMLLLKNLSEQFFIGQIDSACDNIIFDFLPIS